MIDGILDPFAEATSFKSSFPELDRGRMGLEMQFGVNFFNSSGPISLLQIRNGLGQIGTPISLDYMRDPNVLSNAHPVSPDFTPDVPTTGAISLGDYRGEPTGYNPYQ